MYGFGFASSTNEGNYINRQDKEIVRGSRQERHLDFAAGDKIFDQRWLVELIHMNLTRSRMLAASEMIDSDPMPMLASSR